MNISPETCAKSWRVCRLVVGSVRSRAVSWQPVVYISYSLIYSNQQKPNEKKSPGNLNASSHMLFLSSSIFSSDVHALDPCMNKVFKYLSQFKCSANNYQDQQVIKQLSGYNQEMKKKNIVQYCY